MTYRETLQNFEKQFRYKPEIVNRDKLEPYGRIIIAGMGGSRLAPDILAMLRPDLDIRIHSDYGLPGLTEDALFSSLIIANSHSGDTAEVLNTVKTALGKGYHVTMVSTGGQLAEIAREQGLPHIVTPGADIPARLWFGYNLTALSVLLDEKLPSMETGIDEETAKSLADELEGFIPLIYAPDRYNELGYIWKTILNETAKVPAFCNRLPEASHNEMAGFDDSSRELRAKIKCVFIQDDNERLNDRIRTVQAVLAQRKVPFTDIGLKGFSTAGKILSSIVFAHWTALYLAEKSGVDPLTTPIIDELKK